MAQEVQPAFWPLSCSGGSNPVSNVLIAPLYGLSESEFTHILTTFPLAPDPVKLAAQNAYRDAERGLLR